MILAKRPLRQKVRTGVWVSRRNDFFVLSSEDQ